MGRHTGRMFTRALRPDDWPVIETLFGPKGACAGCWCMYWRTPGGKAWKSATNAENRARFEALVKAGEAHGVLAFEGEEAIGWCAVGPRTDFVRLAGSTVLARRGSAGTWSLNCLYIPARHRGKGVATALVAVATAHALALGATEVEAYPVEPREPGKKMPAAFAWTGVPPLFAAAGYTRDPGHAGRAIWVRG